MDLELKFDQQELIANKANKMLGLIRRSFTLLDGPTIKKSSYTEVWSDLC